ncbi:cell division cycle-associated protein 7 [Octopus sinensis]|uniref:Cell division cycle-associated protein 7 n=1 Tax=Octopus sinensis TaxID=2607531 RepID=A0A6P7T4L7_9MOLL|nr:cell division cycle-associated protein 7 [Octopus sinensis]
MAKQGQGVQLGYGLLPCNKRFSTTISEYEQMHNNNIADNKLVLARLLSEYRLEAPSQRVINHKVRRSSTNNKPVVLRRNPARSTRSHYSLSVLAPATRQRRGSVSSTVSSSSSLSSVSPSVSPEKLLVRFPFFKRPISDGSSIDFIDDSDDVSSEQCLLDNRRMARVPPKVKSPDEITEADLELVAEYVSQKKYDSLCGTTCHQCRQKTSDMKTICRSSNCVGVRGQFCGPCLRNRYGEAAIEALKDANWVCPPCRGICNCSFCRRKKGRACTGRMIHHARDMGFSNVSDYLKSLRK